VATETPLGISVYSEPVNATTFDTPQKVHGFFYSLQTHPDNSNVLRANITWRYPESDTPIIYYRINYVKNDLMKNSVVTTHEHFVLGFIKGDSFIISIKAVSAIGCGPASEVLKLGPPCPILNITAKAIMEQGKLNVSWIPPEVDPELHIFYLIKYTAHNSNVTFTMNVKFENFAVLSGLKLGTQYSVEVVANTELGTSKDSTLVTASTFSMAPPPGNVSVSPSSVPGILVVSWTLPTIDPGLKISRYSIQYECCGAGSENTNVNNTGTHVTSSPISGLQLGTTYAVRVAAVAELGVGMYSIFVNGTTSKRYSSASQLNSLWATIALLPLCFGCTVLVTVVLVCVKRKYKGHHGVQTMNAQETEELIMMDDPSTLSEGASETNGMGTTTFPMTADAGLLNLTLYSSNDVTRLEKLGRGSFWKVYEGKVLSYKCAIKKLHSTPAEDTERNVLLKKVLQECDTWASFNHPHIVKLYGYYFQNGSAVPCLIVELMNMNLTGHLNSVRNSNNPGCLFPLVTKLSILRQVAEALQYLHSEMRVIHGDLTANNILIKEHVSGSYTVKVNDFGLSRVLGDSRAEASTAHGTHSYMPPEVHDSRDITEKLDIYSFGVLCVHTLSHKFPKPTYALGIDNGHQVPLSEFHRYRHCLMELSDDERQMERLIECCLQYEIDARPDAYELTRQLADIQDGPSLSPVQVDMKSQHVSTHSTVVQQFYGTVVQGCTISDATLNLSSVAHVQTPTTPHLESFADIKTIGSIIDVQHDHINEQNAIEY
jgi:serine/threonine protein kinase